MGDALCQYNFKDDKSSPTSNDHKIALEAHGESEGLPKSNNESGMDIAPIGNLCTLVNANLRDCPVKTCKGSKLKLELD